MDEDLETSITIQGVILNVPAPYKAGHPLTDGEADALNQTYAENIRNNFAAKIRTKLKEYKKAHGIADEEETSAEVLDKDDLQEDLNEYTASYVMGARNGGGPRRKLDPVTAEAYDLAWEKVKVALKKKNVAINSVSDERKQEFIDTVLAKYPAIREEAQRRVDAKKSLALEAVEL